MARYLLRAKYTKIGVEGLLGEGGTSRRAALRETIEGMGGTLHDLFYAFGDWDLFIITELPDDETATAVSLNISAAGALKVTLTVILTPETIDGAVKKSVPYRAPGA